MASAIWSIRSARRECNAKGELASLDETLTPQEEAARHFTAIYKRSNIRPNEEWTSLNSTPPEHETCQTVAATIKAYPSGKSPGLDGIDRRVLWLLTAAPTFMELLTALYNTCLATGFTPRRWNTSVIAPIPKQGKDPKYISNRRPVALTCLFRRIFEKTILTTIVKSVELNRGQAGFRNGFSCATQVLLAEQARHNNTQNIRVFLDLKSAYVSVPVDKVIVKLANKGVDRYLIKLVESLLTDCSTVIAVNGTLSELVLLEKGLFQGSLLSPILFDVFIDDLATAINGDIGNEIPEGLLFADDILLQSSTECRMHALLGQLEEWCDANEMTINASKSGSTHTGCMFSIKGEDIPQVETYRYLGIPLSKSGIEPKDLIEENIRRAKGAFMLVKKSLASRSWPPATKINVYKTFIRSVIEYAAPILILLYGLDLHKRTIKRGIKEMQKLQDEAVKWIFRKKRPQATLESIAGLTCIQLRFEELTARFRVHLMGASDKNPIKYWTQQGRGSGITNAAATFWIPRDKKVATIQARYRADSFTRAAGANRMASYIDTDARLSNGMDACICMQNSKTRRLAIEWRTNTFGLHHRCKACNKPFTRRHALCIQINVGSAMQKEYDTIMATGTKGEMYTIFDHLLNRKKFQLFASAGLVLIANVDRNASS